MEGEGIDRASALRRLGLGAAALAALGAGDALAGGGGNYPSHPKYRLVFVNHLTTDPLFVATQFGAQDACGLVNCAFQWTGSARADVSEMVDKLNAAISAKADGIAIAITDRSAFDAPVERALEAGIPVVSYNADAPPGSPNKRLAYIGQNLFRSGIEMGERIVELVGSGEVALFAAAPGRPDLQPRIDGAIRAIKGSGKPIKATAVATGSSLFEQLAAVDAYYRGHRKVRGLFAVDAGSTQGVGQVMRKYGLRGRGVRAGGYELLPTTLQLIQQGHLDFTIDQQPYLQGFVPVIQLFLYKLSGGLVAPADTRTGPLFVTKENVKPYLTTRTRFEGSSSKQQVVKP